MARTKIDKDAEEALAAIVRLVEYLNDRRRRERRQAQYRRRTEEGLAACYDVPSDRYLPDGEPIR